MMRTANVDSFQRELYLSILFHKSVQAACRKSSTSTTCLRQGCLVPSAVENNHLAFSKRMTFSSGDGIFRILKPLRDLRGEEDGGVEALGLFEGVTGKLSGESMAQATYGDKHGGSFPKY